MIKTHWCTPADTHAHTYTQEQETDPVCIAPTPATANHK